jgi:tetratricopeptide (TPR) repeat protein
MATTLTAAEEAQLNQTIEMFEVITQSQPQDYQSLEILKEAYSKLGREDDVINTSKRIAQAYVQMGQLSSAILEYETVLQCNPDDPDVKAALAEIESKASSFSVDNLDLPEMPDMPPQSTQAASSEPAPKLKLAGEPAAPKSRKVVPVGDVDDGSKGMRKVFVDAKHITAADFDLCWQTPDPMAAPGDVIDPFVQLLSDKAIFPIEKSLRILADKCRLGLIPLERYEIDLELCRSFPVETCRRWCVLPFDRMSKTVLVATANPFNVQAAKELSEATHNRILWYVASPVEIVKNLRKAFRH